MVLSGSRSGSDALTAAEVEDTSQTANVPVIAEPIARRDVERYVTYHGVLQPRTTVQLAMQVGGRVDELPVDIGDRVDVGDVLMRLDTGDFAAQVRQAEAGLEMATANLERLLRGATAQELTQTRAAVAQAEVQMDNAQTEFDRMERLFQSGSVSRQAYDGAASQLQIAKSQLDSARARLDQVQEGARPEDLAAAEAQVKQAEAALDLARAQLDKATLRAPVAGVISRRGIEVGEMASPGVPLITIVDVDELSLELKAPGRDVVSMASGMTAYVTVEDNASLSFEGRLQRVDVVADPISHLFNLEVRLPNPGEQLRAGFNASARIRVAAAEEVLAAPERAITHRDNQEGFYIVRDGRAIFVPAQFGISDGRAWREIVSAEGVQDGDLIVTVGKEYLTPNMAVRVQVEGSMER